LEFHDEIIAVNDLGTQRLLALWLIAMDVDHSWKITVNGYARWARLFVEPEMKNLASELVSDALVEARLCSEVAPLRVELDLHRQPEFTFGLSMGAILIWLHMLANQPDWKSQIYDAATMVPHLVAGGEWWRMLTAELLHADWKHVLSNAVYLFVFSWGASERIGATFCVFTFWAGGTFGYYVSYEMQPHVASLGASSGVFAVLPLLLALDRGRGFPSIFQRHRYIGATLTLLLLMAFEPSSNIHAHVGGFIGGTLCLLAYHQFSFLRRPQTQFSLAVLSTAFAIYACMVAMESSFRF